MEEVNKEGIGQQWKHKNTGKREELEFVGGRVEILQRSNEITQQKASFHVAETNIARALYFQH